MNDPVDLRSDTVTRPTAGMREAMARAEVGDDVFGEDPTVRALEERLADLFGHEAGLFCPSGTMTNQIAIRVHTRPGDEVICDEGAHVYRYEGGGMMANSGCSVKFVPSDRGRFAARDVQAAINDPENPHLARTRLVNIENTCNRGGGAVWPIELVRGIRDLCDERRFALHMDGARIFNAIAVSGGDHRTWGGLFDSISICLSKGLGAPVGSVLTGDKSYIAEARRVRKRMGGGMRQAGVLAAAGLYALDHHIQRLAEDHTHARQLASSLSVSGEVAAVMPVETNIVIYTLHDHVDTTAHLARLRDRGILALSITAHQVRMVTHLDVDDTAIERTIAALNTDA